MQLADVAQVAVHRVAASWPWYVVRGAGFVAAGLLILLMLSGIGQVTGLTYRFIEPVKAWAVHKALALALVGTIIVHVGFLLIDKYLPFSLVQVLVPFVSHYNNKTSWFGLPLAILGVTMGILAMYAVVIVVATSLGWIDSKKRLWRRTHYLSYAIITLVFLHALYVGSDLKYGIFRSSWIIIGVVLILAIAARLIRAGSLKRDKL